MLVMIEKLINVHKLHNIQIIDVSANNNKYSAVKVH